MCGICGIYNLDGRPVDRNLLERMNSTMIHRGPDDEGYYLEGNVGLGHRRLSIIDLNTGHQPIFNEDKSKVIVFNGEIYNFMDLRTQLEQKGHIFKTKTDTEVILHGYEEWGQDCVSRLRGMFAFALWDKSKRTLFLARDRLGIKPLYYCKNGSKFVLASELKAILEVPNLSRELDLEAVSDYLSFGYIPAPKTIFKGVYKLLPGHILIFRHGDLNLRQYWDLKFHPEQGMSIEDISEEILETLQESIRLRLISDVPLGAFLSGGIDSSAVVAIMSGLIDEPVVTNSVGFVPREDSELEYARNTAKLFNSNHNEYEVSPDAVDVVNKLSWHFDEPFADSSSIPTYYVSKMTKQNVTVALSGDGGDENFAGYRRYYYDRLENQLRHRIPSFIRNNVIRLLAGIYPQFAWMPQIIRAKTLLTNVAHDPVYGYFNSMSQCLPGVKNKVMSGDVKRQLKGYESIEVFRHYYNNADTDDPLSRIQYLDFKTYLVDDILTKVDRASMANSLEVRVPILDHKFVEMVAKIPSDMKLKGKESKYIFKKSLNKVLPPEIMNRKKMGFTIPIGEWMRKDLREMAEEVLFDRNSDSTFLFDMKYVRTLWKQHLSGMKDLTQPLWTLLSFQLWARKFM